MYLLIMFAGVIGIMFGFVVGIYLELSSKPSHFEHWWHPSRFLEIGLAVITTAIAIFGWDASARLVATGLASMFWTLFIYETAPFIYWWLHYQFEPLDKSPEPISEPRRFAWRSAEERRLREQLELAQTISGEQ